jgi:hypothetical protein
VLILGKLSRREVRLLKWCSCKGGLIDASKPIHMIYQEQKVEMLALGQLLKISAMAFVPLSVAFTALAAVLVSGATAQLNQVVLSAQGIPDGQLLNVKSS